MLVNIFIIVLIVEAYLNQNKVIAVFFVAMVLKNAHQKINLAVRISNPRALILIALQPDV